MSSLFLVRHGRTQWTEEHRFAGWGNAPLNKTGVDEAVFAAKTLKASGYAFDVCFTSCLERAKHTANIIHDELGIPRDVLQYKWRLNERHYGALQGQLRADMRQAYGVENVKQWRNNYYAQPPELTTDDPRWQEQLGSLPEVPLDQHPHSESMFQAAQRCLPFWQEQIVPELKNNKNVLIIAHTNSIRSIIASIEGFNDEQSAAFRIATAVPRHYKFNKALKPVKVRDLSASPKTRLRHWATRKRLDWLSRS
ncbi:MAG: 2,3-diphosphoglycerate-dependent phosphoglycerate mutase [Litorimonas sp.]